MSWITDLSPPRPSLVRFRNGRLYTSPALGTSAQLWLNLQNRYDIETAERAIGKELGKIARVTNDAAAQLARRRSTVGKPGRLQCKQEATLMSDIGILNDPLSIAFIILLIGSPGLPLGAIAGALLWRRHRVWGALVGAVVGFALWFVGWLWLTDVI